MFKKILQRGLGAICVFLLLGAGPAAAKAPPPAHPALWAVADADTTVYLFGTIHLLPEKYRWRTPAFDQAVDGSQQLVVETIVDEKNPQKMMSALAGLAFSKGLPPIATRVPEAKRPALEAAIRKAAFRARCSIRWTLGPRPSCCSATSSRTSASKARKASSVCCATISPARAS